MPEGIAVEVENGFATIAPDRAHRAEVLNALLANTPVELIEKLTRSGPVVQYRVPEGNAADAGLLDDIETAERPINRKDLRWAQALKDADPNEGGGVWHHPTEVVKNTIYNAGRDGDNIAWYGPLNPNKPGPQEPPPVPAGAAATSASLQAYVKENSPSPSQISQVSAFSAPAPESTGSYDDGKPDMDWSRSALNDYATNLGITDAASLPNKQAVLDAIRVIEP